MTTPRTSPNADRKAALDAIRTSQQRSERRRTVLISSIAGALVLGLVVATAVVLGQESAKNAKVDALAAQDIDGVETLENLTFDHVDGPVDYGRPAPAGGDHYVAWQNCGVYTEPIGNENGVHSLEHGAVWLTYDPSLPADQVATLAEFAKKESYVLVSPVEGLPSPVVASSWGYQLEADDASDPRIAAFVRKYLLNTELPEVGAACTGGVGTPA